MERERERCCQPDSQSRVSQPDLPGDPRGWPLMATISPPPTTTTERQMKANGTVLHMLNALFKSIAKSVTLERAFR